MNAPTAFSTSRLVDFSKTKISPDKKRFVKNQIRLEHSIFFEWQRGHREGASPPPLSPHPSPAVRPSGHVVHFPPVMVMRPPAALGPGPASLTMM